MSGKKKSLRQQYIDVIMKHKYATDDDKYYNQNLAFLSGLPTEELKNLAEEYDTFDDEDI
jgi:hypothetical protein